MKPKSPPPKKLTLLQLIGSVLSAAVGIQRSKNRERDFTQGKAHVFVIAGVIFVVIFITCVYAVVRFVLQHNGY